MLNHSNIGSDVGYTPYVLLALTSNSITRMGWEVSRPSKIIILSLSIVVSFSKQVLLLFSK